MVVAVIALSFALVGSAFAGPDTLERPLSKSNVRAIAKKQIRKAEPKLRVAHAKKATTANTATTAAPTGPAGGALSGAYPSPGLAKAVVPLTLRSGWEPDPGSETPSVWKDGYGVVHFIGSIQRASGTSSTPFTLPPEFRPGSVKFPGLTIADGYGFLEIQPNGTVTADNLTAGSSIADFLGLEDVEFQAGATAASAAREPAAGAGSGGPG
jgi:hypothetical protein